MAQTPKPENDRRMLRASARANYGSVAAAVVVFGVSQAAGYEPTQAAVAVAAVGAVAIPAIDRAVSKQARIRTLDSIRQTPFVRERGKTLPSMVKPGRAPEKLRTDLGKGDRGRARPTRDRGR
jgi:hypothetical protein